MKLLRQSAIGLLLACQAVVVQAALAAPAAEKQFPPGTHDSGVINVEQLNQLQGLTMMIKGENDTPAQAVKVRTILPGGWTYVENGRKKNSQELDPSIGWYTMIAKPPTTTNETDFVYELRVRANGLMDNLDSLKDASGKPIAIPAKDRNREGMLAIYMNSMISDVLKLGYRSQTKQQSIKPVNYGVIPKEDGSAETMLMGSRPAPMPFTHIKFKHKENGSTIYTFSGVVGEKFLTLRFLVAKDQEEFYESTIALIVNNTWGLTIEQDDAWKKEMDQRVKAAEAQKNKSSKPN